MELQWPLIIFTTLVAWAGGVFGAQSILALRGEAKKAQLPSLIVSVALLAASGVAVFFHLEHWERIFNGFGHLSSGITQELIAIVVFVVVAVVYFAFLRKSEDGGSVPLWLAVVGAAVAVVLVIICAHSYMMAARPAWDTIVWPIAMLAEACAFGPLTVMAICAVRREGSPFGGLCALIGSVANAVFGAILVFVWQMSAGSFASVGYYYDPTHPTQEIVDAAATTNVISGDLAPITWVGIVLIGLVAPIACAAIGQRKGMRQWQVWGLLGALCVAVGAICLRVVFYELGLSVFMFY